VEIRFLNSLHCLRRRGAAISGTTGKQSFGRKIGAGRALCVPKALR